MPKNEMKTILLVEDEAILALSEKVALENYGYSVTIVNSGEKAVEAIKSDAEIDLILMDIDLGKGLDGTQAAAIILHDRDIPIVFVSSHSEREIVEKTEKITSYGYVVKSSSVTVLDASIKMAFKLFEEKKKSKLTNDRLEATFDALPDLLFEVDLEGCYYSYHSSKSELLYLPFQNLIGKHISDVLPAKISDTIMSSILEANEYGISSGRQYEMDVPAGTRSFEITVSRIASFQDKPHFILLCRDITEQRIMEEALEKRIALLTLPLEKDASISFSDLFNIADIQKLQDDFSAATGVASIITETDGTPITAPSNFCRLCKDIIRKNKIGNANCLKSDAALGRMDVEAPCIQPCYSSGLWDAGAGISVGGKHIANWLIGQVRDETQTEENMSEYARVIGADEDDFIEAFREIPAMRKEKFMKIAAALFRLANQLSTLAYQNVQQARMLSERRQVEIALQEKNKEYLFVNEELRAATEKLRMQNEGLQRAENSLRKSEERYKGILRHLDTGIIVHAVDTSIIMSNPRASKLLGVGEAQLKGMLANDPAWEFVREDGKPLPFSQYPVSRIVAERKPIEAQLLGVHRLDTKETVWVVVNGFPLFGSKGEISEILINFYDVTAQKNALETTKRSEELHKAVLQTAMDGYWLMDIQGKLLDVNEAYCAMSGYGKEELLAMHIDDIVFSEDAAEISKRIQRIIKNGSERFNSSHRRKDGGSLNVEVSVQFLPIEGDRIVSFFRNVTERNESRRALEDREEKYFKYIDYAPDGVFVADENGHYVEVNKAACRITGYSKAELLNMSISDLLPEESVETGFDSFKEVSSAGSTNVEIMFRHKDGSKRWWSVDAVKIGKNQAIAFTKDITERKQAEHELRERDERFRSMFYENNAIMLLIEPDTGMIFDANESALAFYGYARKQLLNMSISQINLMPSEEINRQMNLALTGSLNYFTFSHRLSNGETKTVEVHSTPLKISNKTLLYSIIHDITNQKVAEQKISSLLEEKELLLKEVHHRIKNNMGTVSSLLLLQEQSVTEPSAISALQDARRKMQSMAILYDKLYQAPDFTNVSVKDYLLSLIDEIMSNFISGQSVAVDARLDDFLLDSKRLQSLGIIINELLTNIMKYAFLGRESGMVAVSAAKIEGSFTVIVEDNGCGIPESVSLGNSPGFGLQLVQALAQQMEGSVRIERGDGTKVILDFKL